MYLLSDYLLDPIESQYPPKIPLYLHRSLFLSKSEYFVFSQHNPQLPLNNQGTLLLLKPQKDLPVHMSSVNSLNQLRCKLSLVNPINLSFLSLIHLSPNDLQL